MTATPTPGDLSARQVIADMQSVAELRTIRHSYIGKKLKGWIAALSALPAAGGECTCPSGDGSLRWPCPRHPPTPQPSAAERCCLTFPCVRSGAVNGACVMEAPPPDAAVGAQGDGDDRALIDAAIKMLRADGFVRSADAIRRLATPAAGKGVDDALIEHLQQLDAAFPERTEILLTKHTVRRIVAALTRQPEQSEAIETIKRIAAQLATEDCEGDAADLIDAMHALTRQPEQSDDDLPGMWSHSDFTGGDPDERPHHERTRQPVAGDGMVLVPRVQLQHVHSALSDSIGDTDPYVAPDATDDEVRTDEPVLWACQQISAMLAAPAATPTDGGEGS